jgi:GNAT superfamily N-acetyltransferase
VSAEAEPANRHYGGLGPHDVDSRAEVRQAGDADVGSLIELRAAWKGGPVDPAYVAAFEQWWERERDQRVTWLAESGDRPVGMLNMLVFTRMPTPGRPRSQWGYVANVFVVEALRNAGIGRRLVDAATAYADAHDFARLVLSPSPRSVPFYQRAGFDLGRTLMTRQDG